MGNFRSRSLKAKIALPVRTSIGGHKMIADIAVINHSLVLFLCIWLILAQNVDKENNESNETVVSD